jgi:solute carrier family 25 protein 33/36
MAGVITVTVVNPIWVIKTRLQLQGLPSVQAGLEAGGARAAAPGAVVYRGSWHALTQILREEGVRGLYKGLIPSIWGVSETAIQFVLYERLKSMIAARTLQQQHVDTHRACPAPSSSSSTSAPQTELRNLEYIAAAASAKVVASCATYPHEVIRTRLRERGASQIYSSALHCVRRVWVEEGMRGMYGGLFTHLLRVVPNTAILFFTYEKVAKLLTVE